MQKNPSREGVEKEAWSLLIFSQERDEKIP
jgi:hypothetical protein